MCIALVVTACGGADNAASSRAAGAQRTAATANTPTKVPVETTTTTVAPPTTTTTTTTTTTQPPTTTTSVPAEPIVFDSGFSYGPDGDLSYAVILENPTDDAALISLWLDVNFIDDEDRIADTRTEVIDFLLPRAQTAVGGNVFDPPENIVDIEIAGEWQYIRVEDAEAGAWTVTDLAYSDDFFEEITGYVSHTFGDDMDIVQMTAVFYDQAGDIIGGDWGFVDVPAGREVAFEITLFDPPPFHTYEVFVAP